MMELLLICGLLIMLFINIAWFVCLKDIVSAMESMKNVIEANVSLSKTIVDEMIKNKMKENTK